MLTIMKESGHSMAIAQPITDTAIKGHNLSELLEYTNQNVIDAFCAALDIAEKDAKIIFGGMLRYFWLCETSNEACVQAIDAPVAIIDEMWHMFILFTKDYARFCRQYFGHFIHHVPTTEKNKKSSKEDRKKDFVEKLISEKKKRYEIIYDQLGKQAFIRWYYEFPEKYSMENIKKMRCK
ncbi:MAG TPA: hypothetical protein VFP95_02735 [Gammaproteobacteria bacterium]|nr:hypothetical protein [Gammaproteobacteria bacterium]